MELLDFENDNKMFFEGELMEEQTEEKMYTNEFGDNF